MWSVVCAHHESIGGNMFLRSLNTLLVTSIFSSVARTAKLNDTLQMLVELRGLPQWQAPHTKILPNASLNASFRVRCISNPPPYLSIISNIRCTSSFAFA